MKKYILILFIFIIYSAQSQTNVNMPSGTNTTVVTTCNANFYDTGGSLGNHGINQNSSIRFVPATAGMAIRIQFNIFTVGNGATMLIYDGPDATYNLIATYNEFINPSGIAVVSGPQPNNPDGSIFVQFTSGTMNEIGWAASVTCRAPCQSFNIMIDPAVTTKPLVEDIYMNTCKDSCLTFGAKAVFLQNNINYSQTQANTMFIWRFGFTQVDTTQVITKCFDQARGWDYTLYAIDTMACFPNTIFKGRIRVSDNPIVGAPSLPDACSNGIYNVYVGNDPQSTVQVATVGSSISGTLSHADTVFLPDGNSVEYYSDILFDIFDPGQTLTNLNHLLGVRMTLEHTYLGDLSIRLTCPSGQTVVLKSYSAGNPVTTGTITNACSLGGGGTHLGSAIDANTGNACYLSPGIGWEYEFKPGATNCFGGGGPTVGYTHVDPCGVTWSGNSLVPSVPNPYTSTPTTPAFYGSYESLTNLLGCPLNGNWRITVKDNLTIDNGHIFSWSLSLDQSIIPGGWSYNVDVDTVLWHGADIVPTGKTSAYINLSTPGVNNYTLTIVDEYGCEYDTTFTIEVVQSPIPNINDGVDTARICTGEIMILNANYQDPEAEYWWNTGATTDEIMTLVEGLYYVEVTASTIDGNLTCTGNDSIYVSINPHPIPDFDVNKKESCAPLDLQFTNLTTPLDIPLTYIWRIYNVAGQEVFTSDQINPNFFVEEPGSYSVQLIVSTENGCVDSVMRWNFFEVHPQPIAEFSFNPEISLLSETGGVINFTNYCDSIIFANNPNATWYWDYADGTRESVLWNPVHTYATWGDYDVEFNITTAFGCKSSIKHTVIIEEDLQFPNIITPNGDGFNDVFAVKNLNIDINPEDPDQYRANSLQIYDRWGKKVYDEENYDTYMKDEQIYVGSKVFDAHKLQDGQYYFSFNYKGKVKSVKYSGSLLIIRSK